MNLDRKGCSEVSRGMFLAGVIAGLAGSVVGCGKTVTNGGAADVAVNKQSSVESGEVKCGITDSNAKKPDPICGMDNIRQSVAANVRLGIAKVECRDNRGTLTMTSMAEGVCDVPLWQASEREDAEDGVCLLYTGCEPGHLVITARTVDGRVLLVKRQ